MIEEGEDRHVEPAKDGRAEEYQEYHEADDAGHIVVALLDVVRQEVTQDARSVQRRNGNQIEDGQHDIDDDGTIKQKRQRINDGSSGERRVDQSMTEVDRVEYGIGSVFEDVLDGQQQDERNSGQ